MTRQRTRWARRCNRPLRIPPIPAESSRPECRQRPVRMWHTRRGVFWSARQYACYTAPARLSCRGLWHREEGRATNPTSPQRHCQRDLLEHAGRIAQTAAYPANREPTVFPAAAFCGRCELKLRQLGRSESGIVAPRSVWQQSPDSLSSASKGHPSRGVPGQDQRRGSVPRRKG